MPGWTDRRRAGARASAIPQRLVSVLLVAVVVGTIVVVVGATLSSSPAHPARPVAIASGSWAPFVGPDLDDGGPVTRIVTEALRSEGYDPTVSYSSWPLALDRTRRAEVFGSFPFVGSEARREDYYLSDPIIEFDYVLFYSTRHHPEPPEIRSAEDLRGLRVGRIAGYDLWAELDEAVAEYVTFESSVDAFRALDAGEVDLLPEGLLPGRALIEGPDLRSGSADFGIVDSGPEALIGSTETLHVMMPRTPEARDLMPRVNAALDAIRDTDLYALAMADLGPGGEGSQTVELVPVGDGGLVEMTDEADGSALLAPPGTRAMVLDWPDAFSPATGIDGDDGAGTGGGGDGAGPGDPARVRVKVLNGPAAGRVVTVDARAVHLPEPDGGRPAAGD